MRPEVPGLWFPIGDQILTHSENILRVGHISTRAISTPAQQPGIFTIPSSRQRDQGLSRLI